MGWKGAWTGKDRPEITTRKLDEVVPRVLELGFNYHTICDFERAGWCVQVEEIGKVPDVAHWTILYQDTVRTNSGHEGDNGSNVDIWKMWVFDDRDLWLQVVQCYYEDAADMSSPTNTRGHGGPMKLAFTECSGKVIPHISVSLAMDPLG
jgi:hypothetical protein